MGKESRILFIGDIVGKPGRAGLASTLPQLKDRFGPNIIIANSENSAGGLGITEKVAKEILGLGVDVLTLGNHAFRRREVYDYLDRESRVVRPANFLPSNPGRGWTIVEKDGVRFGVVNLSGTLMLTAAHSPFLEIDRLLAEMEGKADLLVVDFHAETTSEKVAMGWYLDGRVTCVIGTHTHVPTADAVVLPGGTAYLTDAGMTGPRDSVIGVKKEQVLERFLTQMPVKFETASNNVWVTGAIVVADQDGLASSIELVQEPVE